MSVVLFRGDAVAIAQVSTATITAYDATTTYIVTINGKTVTQIGSGGSVSTTAVLLLAALQASTIPEFVEVTWTNPSGGIITGTAASAGVPFTVTSGVSGGAGTFGAFSTTTASAGPNDWSTALNWSGGAVPVDSDDVYIDNVSTDILYGLGQSAVTLTSLNIGANFTGKIGNPLVNASNYYEYRKTRLEIGATTLNVGKGAGSGSGRIRLSLGAVTTAINVYMTGSAIDEYGALDVQGNGGNTYICNLFKGSVGFATEPSQVAVLVINQGFQDNPSGDVSLYLGSGCTLTTMAQTGGTVKMFCGATTYGMTGGSVTVVGTGAFTTLTIDSGTFNCQSSGTITTLKVGGGGVYDRSEDQRAKTITNSTLEANSTFRDPNKTITFTNAMKINRCGGELVGELTIDLGTDYSITRS